MLKGANRQGLATTVGQERGFRSDGKAPRQVEAQQQREHLPSRGVEGDEPGLTALAEAGRQVQHFARGAPLDHVKHPKTTDFRDPETGVEQQNQHGPVPDPEGASEGNDPDKIPNFGWS